MRWLIFVLFATAFVSSFLWYEAADRNFTSEQKLIFGVMALVAWVLVLVLGNTML